MKVSCSAGSAVGSAPNRLSTWFWVMMPLWPKTKAWVPAGRPVSCPFIQSTSLLSRTSCAGSLGVLNWSRNTRRAFL